MKNLHLLPTEKASRFSLNSSGKYHLTNQLHTNSPNFTNQHIYITSDEEIKIDDYYLGDDNHIYCLVTTVNSNGKKIILTTDTQLIKDGVQSINDEFLEWFVNNPSCEEVEVEKKSYIEIKEISYKEGFQEEMQEFDTDCFEEPFISKEFIDKHTTKQWEVMSKEETIQETVTRFINKGVYKTKITSTESPSVVIWSKTRKCLVGGKDQPDSLEIVDDGNGNKKVTYDNNISISLQNRSELTESDVKEINESEGIVVTNATYGKPYFRFGFIPN